MTRPRPLDLCEHTLRLLHDLLTMAREAGQPEIELKALEAKYSLGQFITVLAETEEEEAE